MRALRFGRDPPPDRFERREGIAQLFARDQQVDVVERAFVECVDPVDQVEPLQRERPDRSLQQRVQRLLGPSDQQQVVMAHLGPFLGQRLRGLAGEVKAPVFLEQGVDLRVDIARRAGGGKTRVDGLLRVQRLGRFPVPADEGEE